MTTRSVLVAGAGIAGLSAAIGLHRRGHQVTLVERAPSLGALGAGVVLQPNALAALRDIGVSTEGLGQPIGQACITDASGRVLQTNDLSTEAHGASLGVYRPALCDRLAQAARPIPTLLSTTVESLAEHEGGVDVGLSDGTTTRVDVVLGCDGIRSRTRTQALGARAPAVAYSGYTCWRAVLRDVDTATVAEMWGPGLRLGVVPVGGGRVYTFLVANAPAHGPGADAAALRARFAGFGGVAPQVLAALRDEALLHHDIEALTHVAWGTPRVWLLGDAAHAMTPNLGQGAGLALEDASTAVRALDAADVPRAFRLLVAARDARARGLLARSRWFGQVAQWEAGWACALRDAAVRLTPASASQRALEPVLSWRPGDGLP